MQGIVTHGRFKRHDGTDLGNPRANPLAVADGKAVVIAGENHDAVDANAFELAVNQGLSAFADGRQQDDRGDADGYGKRGQNGSCAAAPDIARRHRDIIRQHPLIPRFRSQDDRAEIIESALVGFSTN